MPIFGTKVELSSAQSGSIALADVLQIAGAFKTYETVGDRDAVDIIQFENNQIVYVSASNQTYIAEKIEANPPFTFTDTLNWHEFYFPTEGGGGLTNAATASLLTTASAVNNVITFTQGDGSTFTLTVATGSGGGGGGVSSYADLTNVPSGILSSSNQFQNLGDITISGSFLPSANEAFDLGSDTLRWRDLHLSGSSIFMGGNLITIQDGALRVFEGQSPTGSFLQSKLSGSFTGSFKGDGSSLTNVSAAPFFAATGSRYVTIEDIEISGSLMLDFSEAIPPLEIASGGVTYVGVNGEGVTYFATRSSAPEVHKGGFYLDTNYNLYLGTD